MARGRTPIASGLTLAVPCGCRRVAEGDESVREVRISCPDATGLGCDIARMLLDFGLRILSSDLSTDGTWCYLVFVVRNPTHPPHHTRTSVNQAVRRRCRSHNTRTLSSSCC